MNIVLINNNEIELNNLENLINEIYEKIEITKFTDPMLCAKYVWYNDADLILSDSEMRPVDCLDLLRVIRKRKPNVAFIILGNEEYMKAEAKNMAVYGYQKKPINKENIQEIFRKLEVQGGHK